MKSIDVEMQYWIHSSSYVMPIPEKSSKIKFKSDKNLTKNFKKTTMRTTGTVNSDRVHNNTASGWTSPHLLLPMKIIHHHESMYFATNQQTFFTMSHKAIFQDFLTCLISEREPEKKIWVRDWSRNSMHINSIWLYL